MLAFNYSAAVFVITMVTYLLMSLFWGKGILASLQPALFLASTLGGLTLLSSILFFRKHTKVYELKDDQKED